MTPSGGGETRMAPLSEYGVRPSRNGFNYPGTSEPRCTGTWWLGYHLLPRPSDVERASGASIA